MEFMNNNSNVATFNWALEKGPFLRVTVSVARKDLSAIHCFKILSVNADLAAKFGHPLALIRAMTSLGDDTNNVLVESTHIDLHVLSSFMDTSTPCSIGIQVGALAPSIMLKL